MADEAAATTVPAPEAVSADWQPQQTDDSGVFLSGELPTNHRLRAEALAKARRKSDPDGLISDDLIADAADRLRNEREAEAASRKEGGKG
jgi:hypothetical protein